jgi:hypothetical protein
MWARVGSAARPSGRGIMPDRWRMEIPKFGRARFRPRAPPFNTIIKISFVIFEAGRLMGDE